jgi:hypothetical protein
MINNIERTNACTLLLCYEMLARIALLENNFALVEGIITKGRKVIKQAREFFGETSFQQV